MALGNDVKFEALKTFEFNRRHDDLSPAIFRQDIRLLHVNTIHVQIRAL